MASITLTPSEQEIQSFLSQYQKALSPSKNPYIRYFLRFPQATVSIYTSGKVLLQGEAAEQYVAHLVGQQGSVDHRGLFDGLSRDAKAQKSFESGAFDGDCEGRAGVAAQQSRNLLAVNPAIGFAAHPHIFIVDAHNDIARSDTGFPNPHVQSSRGVRGVRAEGAARAQRSLRL